MTLGIDEIEKILMKKENALDKIMLKNRKIVRLCSNSIKAVHAYDLKQARTYLKKADSEIKKIKSVVVDFPGQINHVLQEYAEAKIVLSAVEKKHVPRYRELAVLGVTSGAYIRGLLDSVGELKREMYESLRRGNKHEAGIYFGMMERIYDQLLPLRFSNAILPEFRRKQDVARLQIEQARGELLKFEM